MNYLKNCSINDLSLIQPKDQLTKFSASGCQHGSSAVTYLNYYEQPTAEVPMWYAIISEDHPNSLENRKAARPAHLERLTDLQNEGRLLIAGPHPLVDSEDPGSAGFSGSLVVAEFANLEEANAWADADPYVEGGVYAKVVVKPFKKVLPS